MKRVFSALLVLSMLLCLVPTASASEYGVYYFNDATETGSWGESPSLKNYDDGPTWYAYNPSTAVYQPVLFQGGKYKVSFWNTVHSTNLPVLPIEVKDKNGTHNFTIPHKDVESGFVELGTFDFEPGDSGYIKVDASAAGSSFARIGGVKYELVEPGEFYKLELDIVEGDTITYPTREISAKDVKVLDAADCAVKFYVKAGADGDGTEANPFGSIDAAKAKVREVVKEGIPQGGIGIFVHGGTYKLDSSFTFEDADSGKEGSPVIWQAYGDEKVIITGATVIDHNNIKPVDDPALLKRIPAKDKVYETDLSLSGISNISPMDFKKSTPYLLTFGEKAGTIARWPNEGYGRTADVADSSSRDDSGPRKKGFTYEFDDARPLNWLNAKDVWLKGYWVTPYDLEYSKVTSIDTENMRISGKHNTIYGAYGNSRYIVTNLMEEIDMPGEWYFDASANKLYFYPVEGWENENISFVTSNFPLVKFTPSASYVAIRGFNLEGGGAAGVYMESENCSVIGVTITNVSGDGADIYGKNNIIRDSDVFNVGNQGILVSGGDMYKLSQANNIAENNVVHDVGLTGSNQTGIYVTGCGNKVLYNHIYNTGARCITGSGMEHTIEYNVMERSNLEMSDSGSLYYNNTGVGYGTKINYNIVRDAVGLREIPGFSGEGCMGLYVDTNTSGVEITNNILMNVKEPAIFINCGRDSVLNNNIMINCKQPLTVATSTAAKAISMGGIVDTTVKAFPYNQEPFLSKYPTLATIYEDNFGYPVNTEVRNNVKFASGAYSFSGAVSSYKGVESGNISFDEMPDCDLNTFYDFDFDAIKAVNPEFKDIPVREIGIYTGGARKDTTAIVFNNQVNDFELAYPANGAIGVDPSVTLEWGATRGGIHSYKIYFSEDAEMNRVIDVQTSKEANLSMNLDFGKTYYWRVQATPMLDYDARWNSGGTFSFTTISVEDKITEEVANAEFVLESIPEGTEKYQVPAGSKEKLQGVIDKAKEVKATGDYNAKKSAVTELSQVLNEYITKQNIDTNDLKMVVFDNYNGDTIGERPLGLFLRSYAPLNVTVQNDPTRSGNKTVKWMDQEPNYHYGQRYYESQDKYIEAQTSVMPAQRNGAFSLTLIKTGIYTVESGVNNSVAAKVVFAPDGMIYGDMGYKYPLMNYEENTWYNVKIAATFATQTYDVYIDGKVMAEDIPFSDKKVKEVNQFVFDTSDGTVGANGTKKSTRGTFYTDNTIVRVPNLFGDNPFLTDITLNGETIEGFSAGQQIYNLDIPSDELLSGEIGFTTADKASTKVSQIDGKVCISVLSNDKSKVMTYVISGK